MALLLRPVACNFKTCYLLCPGLWPSAPGLAPGCYQSHSRFVHSFRLSQRPATTFPGSCDLTPNPSQFSFAKPRLGSARALTSLGLLCRIPLRPGSSATILQPRKARGCCPRSALPAPPQLLFCSSQASFAKLPATTPASLSTHLCSVDEKTQTTLLF